MNQFTINTIGTIVSNRDHASTVRIDPTFRKALNGLEGFTWLNVIWWAHLFDTPEQRMTLEIDKPYCMGPDHLGIFSTRSPVRPNPIMVSAVMINSINLREGSIEVPYIDAEDGTPVLDLKPYHGSTDRAESWEVPDWCSDWPKSIEASAMFAWDKVFNF